MRVSVAKSNRSFRVAPGQSVLDAALHAGLNLPHGCKGGNCGACRARLVQGEVRYPHGRPLGLTDAEADDGFILLCQARAGGDLAIDIAEISSPQEARVKRLPSRIERVEHLGHDVMAVYLRLPPAEPFHFEPGQYIDIMLPGGRRRSFSIASPPHDSRLLELHIRRVDGGEFTERLFTGDPRHTLLSIEGPLGQFVYRPAADHGAAGGAFQRTDTASADGTLKRADIGTATADRAFQRTGAIPGADGALKRADIASATTDGSLQRTDATPGADGTLERADIGTATADRALQCADATPGADGTLERTGIAPVAPMLLVGGGTGLAPIKSILRHVIENGLPRELLLYWGVRSERDLYCHRELQELAHRAPNFRYRAVLSEPDPHWTGRRGWVHEAVLADFPSLDGRDIYASGPPAMIAAVRQSFELRGADAKRLFFDSFDYAPDTLERQRSSAATKS